MPQPRHHRRTQHVQHHFLRRPRIQPCRPRQHFRPHFRRNHDFRQPSHRHAQVGRHRHRRRAAPARILQRPQHIRRRAARCDSHHHVVPRQSLCPQIPLPVPRRILRSFHCVGNRAPAPGNERLHQFRRSPKRRRTFRRVQHSHSSARPCSHIKEPSASSNPVHNRVHGTRNRRQLSPHSDCHFAVLTIHQPHNLHRRHAVQVSRRRIPLFRQPMVDKEDFFGPIFYGPMFLVLALRALAFLRLESHHRIISAQSQAPRAPRQKKVSFAPLVNAKDSNSALIKSRPGQSAMLKLLVPAIRRRGVAVVNQWTFSRNSSSSISTRRPTASCRCRANSAAPAAKSFCWPTRKAGPSAFSMASAKKTPPSSNSPNIFAATVFPSQKFTPKTSTTARISSKT